MAEAIDLDLNTTDINQLDPRVKQSLIEIQSSNDKKEEPILIFDNCSSSGRLPRTATLGAHALAIRARVNVIAMLFDVERRNISLAADADTIAWLPELPGKTRRTRASWSCSKDRSRLPFRMIR